MNHMSMQGRRTTSHRRSVALAVAVIALLASPGAALAAWSASGAGTAAGAAATMPSGTAPSGTPGTGSVTLSWSSVNLSDGAPVTGYQITRYDGNGVSYAVSASCAGVVANTTCTEQAVPAGTWFYRDTPVVGGWTGGVSPLSAAITVG
jgi:Flp pilus assembly protein TadG